MKDQKTRSNRQRYILHIEEGIQHISPITDDHMVVTIDQLKREMSLFLPEYSLRKKSKIEMLLKKWHYKLYLGPKIKKNDKIFSEKVREANIKNNPHFKFKEHQ